MRFMEGQNGNATAIAVHMDTDKIVPYTIDELYALYSKTRNYETRVSSIIKLSGAIISVLSSSTLIWMISRSEQRFGSVQNRLLLGVCICDIIFSLSLSPCNSMAPASDAYITWNAKGTMVTCQAQSFLMYFGLIASLFYHTSLNLFYLLVIKYDKSEEYIRTKIELYFHGIPIMFGLALPIFALFNGNLNPNGNGGCMSPINDLPHCVGYEAGEIRNGFETSCNRGADTFILFAIFYSTIISLPSIVITSSMIIICRYIEALEKKMSKFGAFSFRAKIQERENMAINGNAEESTDRGCFLRKKFSQVKTFVRKWILCEKDSSPTCQSRISVERRTMMNKALAYCISCLSTLCVYFVPAVLHFILKQERNYVVFSIASFFGCIQGLYNLMIYSHPKAINIKVEKNISYCESFVKVVMFKHVRNEDKQSNRGSLISLNKKFRGRFAMKLRKTSKAWEEVIEEEKCEIFPFEEKVRMSLEKDQHLLEAIPATKIHNLFPISAEPSKVLKTANIHHNVLNEMEEDEVHNSQSFDLSPPTDAQLDILKLEKVTKAESVVAGAVEIRRSSMDLIKSFT